MNDDVVRHPHTSGEYAHVIDNSTGTARADQQQGWEAQNAQPYGTAFTVEADHPRSCIDP